MTYQIIDSLGNTFDLNYPDLFVSSDVMQSDIKIIEKTFRDGAVFAGIMRIKSKDIDFVYAQYDTTDTTFRTAINQLASWCKKAYTIKNVTLSIQTNVVFDSIDVTYEQGSLYRYAKATFKFKRLNPFWENSTATNYTIAGVAGGTSGTISITNNGWFEVLPIITLDAAELITKIIFHIPSTNEGMYVKDLQFGLSGLTQYIIDNTQGFIKLGGYKRNQNIQQGTGFFQFPIGTFDFYYMVNGNAAISIDFNERNLI